MAPLSPRADKTVEVLVKVTVGVVWTALMGLGLLLALGFILSFLYPWYYALVRG